ncbi:ribosomal protein L43, mitochondrial, putative [Babesia caballi]|uniref:Ribosomal protein L43, mitochondrial, putative n=1 Tax=Babesia caballi TaxID=5871 RepID=A0AAV4LWQ7_BABCB|nr:ribosomal protein L43, mitochondrial, putative [Babesia caballi]
MSLRLLQLPGRLQVRHKPQGPGSAAHRGDYAAALQLGGGNGVHEARAGEGLDDESIHPGPVETDARISSGGTIVVQVKGLSVHRKEADAQVSPLNLVFVAVWQCRSLPKYSAKSLNLNCEAVKGNGRWGDETIFPRGFDQQYLKDIFTRPFINHELTRVQRGRDVVDAATEDNGAGGE